MPKDFLFDIGKVLLDFNFETSLTTLLPAGHPDPAAALSKLLAKKDDFEAGLISVGDYTNWALETMESTATPEQFHTAWQNIFTPNIPMWEAARSLAAQGHRLILFSNTNAIHCPKVFEDFPKFSLFHGSILSFEVNSIKPHPEIYQHAIDKYALVPEKTLYIDDLPANIATGNQFGFKTHQYILTNHTAFEQWLAEQLSSHNGAQRHGGTN
ncbi:MAG: HAD family phosphatase [Verrucomicrobia bacterium]|nr:HAD family phosphatase [Verrucomicrobiota bacterium]